MQALNPDSPKEKSQQIEILFDGLNEKIEELGELDNMAEIERATNWIRAQTEKISQEIDVLMILGEVQARSAERDRYVGEARRFRNTLQRTQEQVLVKSQCAYQSVQKVQEHNRQRWEELILEKEENKKKKNVHQESSLTKAEEVTSSLRRIRRKMMTSVEHNDETNIALKQSNQTIEGIYDRGLRYLSTVKSGGNWIRKIDMRQHRDLVLIAISAVFFFLVASYVILRRFLFIFKLGKWIFDFSNFL